MEILASDTISGKSSNVISYRINVLNLQFLFERAKKLGAQQRVRKLNIVEVAIALIAYLGTQGNSSSEGFCIASLHAFFLTSTLKTVTLPQRLSIRLLIKRDSTDLL